MALQTSHAIVIAGALVAGGLYFGLRDRTPAPTAAPTSAPAPTPSAEAPTNTAPQDAFAAVHRALVDWRAACWDSADAATRKPGRYVATFAFAEAGTPVISGITEDRDRSDPQVAQCLRGRVHEIVIPAPGVKVSVDVPFELP